jgi:predicted ester cyclase
MSTESNKAIVWRMNKEFIEGRNQTTFNEILAEHFIDRTAMPGMPPGPAGVKAFFTMMWQAFPDMTVEIYDQVAEGDYVITRKTFHGTHDGDFMGIAPTHKRVQINVMDKLRLESGQLVEHWGIVDQMGLMQQLGVISE